MSWPALEPTLFVELVGSGPEFPNMVKRMGFNVPKVVNLGKRDGLTALHQACKLGHKENVEWLISEAGADLEKPDLKGSRAIHYAVDGNEPDIIELLVEKGAQLDSQNNGGMTAVHSAVCCQYTDCLLLLIKLGCDVNLEDVEGNTPFHYAIHYGGAPEILQILTASSKVLWKLRNKKGYNVLHLAAARNNLEAIEFILQNGDKDLVLDWWPETRSTILHLACFQRNLKLVKFLLEHFQRSAVLSTLLEAKGTAGKTALLVACQQMDRAAIELLIEAGANVNAVDINGNTAAMIAANNLLVEDKNKSYKELALAISQYSEMVEKHPALTIVAYLIEKGCRWNKANKTGGKISGVLRAKGCTEDVIQILQKIAEKRRKSCIVPPAATEDFRIKIELLPSPEEIGEPNTNLAVRSSRNAPKTPMVEIYSWPN